MVLEIGDDAPRASLGRRGTEVLRIAGEALTNARRHAAARHVVVRVNGQLVVEVADDGRGFDPEQPPAALSGQGLRGMRERAALLGGRLDVRTGAAGTTVRLELDLGQAAAAAAGTTAGGPS